MKLPPIKSIPGKSIPGRRGGAANRASSDRQAVSRDPDLALRYPWTRLGVGAATVLAVALLATSQGSVWMPPFTVLKIVVSGLPMVDISPTWPDSWDTIVWRLRLPRVVLAGVVGAALALSGATYQGLFRNPLADPSLIGASSGAALGATAVLVAAVPERLLGLSVLPVAAFGGAIVAVALAYIIARQSEGLPLTTLILAGVAVGSIATALTSLLMIRGDPNLRPVLSWLLGGFIAAQWKHSAITLPYLVPSLLVVLSYGRILNVMQLNEHHAAQLGVNVERTKVLLICAATLSTAVAVSFSGIIGFVGLVAPHVVRLVWGPDYRSLLPTAALVGAGFLILADLVARTAVSPGELPVGVVTAFCGAPFLLYLLRRRKRATM